MSRKKTVTYWLALIASVILNALQAGGVAPTVVDAPALFDACP